MTFQDNIGERDDVARYESSTRQGFSLWCRNANGRMEEGYVVYPPSTGVTRGQVWRLNVEEQLLSQAFQSSLKRGEHSQRNITQRSYTA